MWRDWFHTHGIRRDDPSTWQKKLGRKLSRAKRDAAFHTMLGAPLRDLADALLGKGWTTPEGFGNLLADFPDSERWRTDGDHGCVGGCWGGRVVVDGG